MRGVFGVGKMGTVSIYLKDELEQRIRERAKDQGVSFSKFLQSCLERFENEDLTEILEHVRSIRKKIEDDYK